MAFLAEKTIVDLSADRPLTEAECIALGGLKAYICTPAGEPFDGGDVQRFGWIFLVPTPARHGAKVRVYGARIYSRTTKGIEPLGEPVTWTGAGDISCLSDHPHFRYRSDSSKRDGTNDDDFLICSGETWPGHFESLEPSGRMVTGRVDLYPMDGDELPVILQHRDLHLRRALPLQVHAEWAERLFQAAKPRATAGKTHALIDIIRGKTVLVRRDESGTAAAKLESEFPNSVLFRMPLDGKIERLLV